jgi:hypothetical protein
MLRIPKGTDRNRTHASMALLAGVAALILGLGGVK